MKRNLLLAIAILLLAIAVVPVMHVFAKEEADPGCDAHPGYSSWYVASSHHYGNGNGYCNMKHEYVEWYRCSKCNYVSNTRLRTIQGGCGAKI